MGNNKKNGGATFKGFTLKKESKKDVRDELYGNIKLRPYDVLRMTEEEFLRLSALPNFGYILVDGYKTDMTLAVALKHYNPDLYNKYQLLLNEYEQEESNEEEEEEEEDIDIVDAYDEQEEKEYNIIGSSNNAYNAHIKSKVKYQSKFNKNYEDDLS